MLARFFGGVLEDFNPCLRTPKSEGGHEVECFSKERVINLFSDFMFKSLPYLSLPSPLQARSRPWAAEGVANDNLYTF